jgi:ubiquinone/menaquinone biosynthesis C-methylase UbiE
MDAQGFYDGLGGDYDLMVSWPERMAREQSFFARVFDEGGAHRVLDAACGTGIHAISFAKSGRECTGADLSPVMVEKARQNARDAGVSVSFVTAGFGGLRGRVEGSFDAVTCIGNSLPHLLDDESLHGCLADFAELLRPGGLLVIQNRNYDRLLSERQRFMPVSSRLDPEGETLFLRITEYGVDERIEFTVVTLKKRGGRWSQAAQSTPLRALRQATLQSGLSRAGFSSVRFYGAYDSAPFDAASSGDLVAIAVR